MKVYEACDKRFLSNNPHEQGSVSWYVEGHQYRKYGTANIAADVQIRDCFGKVNLEFYSSSPARHKERLNKLDELINSLLNMRQCMAEAREENVKAILKYREENKGERFKGEKTKKIRKTGCIQLKDVDGD